MLLSLRAVTLADNRHRIQCLLDARKILAVQGQCGAAQIFFQAMPLGGAGKVQSEHLGRGRRP
ncbi:hypothetical protein FHT12_000795 [Xanthomonas campestris]|nr:hypothetical protein [Xanthomonas euroxanthea]